MKRTAALITSAALLAALLAGCGQTAPAGSASAPASSASSTASGQTDPDQAAADQAAALNDAVKAAGSTTVVLRPLMVEAGDHANNDMAGEDPESWKSLFTAAGLEVDVQIAGLGSVPAVQQLYVDHTGEAMASL